MVRCPAEPRPVGRPLHGQPGRSSERRRTGDPTGVDHRGALWTVSRPRLECRFASERSEPWVPRPYRVHDDRRTLVRRFRGRTPIARWPRAWN